MRSARQLLVVLALGSSAVVVVSTARADDASTGVGADTRAGRPLEQALIQRLCDNAPPSFGVDAFQIRNQCLNDQLASLRADFGYDLGRLSAAERKQLNASCPPGRPEEREAYLDCVYSGLLMLRDRWIASRPPASSGTAPDPLVASEPPTAAAPPLSRPTSRRGVIVVSILGTLTLAAAAAFLALRRRSARHLCRSCGARFPEAGDLCPACRRQAAEALRQAAAERADRERSRVEEQRRQREQAEKERLEKARLEDDARQRDEEAAAQRREEELRRREAEEASRNQTQEPVEEAFDPYRILGVSREARREEIRASYEEARLKYDEAAVAHLGDDVRRHFKAKAEAVEQAYRALVVDAEALAN